MDLGCNGSDLYRTPNIDRLAAQGTRFTHAYSAGHVCSPTRASLLTGKYPARLHITDWIAGHDKPYAKLRVPEWTKKLPESDLSLAKVLKPQGYATAWIGKWHLGGGAQDHGFEAGAQHWNLNRKQDPKDPKGVYTLTAEAIDFISRHREQPFLVTLSHYAPHSPLRAEAGAAERYEAIIAEKKPRQTNAVYAGMVEALDKSVGRLLDWLEKNQLAENTFVIFTSDNGGQLGPTSNAPLRGGKGTHYEGGVRVPFVARWPGKIPAGATNDARAERSAAILEGCGAVPASLATTPASPHLWNTLFA
jgi:arylsulfatase A-like enzyme